MTVYTCERHGEDPCRYCDGGEPECSLEDCLDNGTHMDAWTEDGDDPAFAVCDYCRSKQYHPCHWDGCDSSWVESGEEPYCDLHTRVAEIFEQMDTGAK